MSNSGGGNSNLGGSGSGSGSGGFGSFYGTWIEDLHNVVRELKGARGAEEMEDAAGKAMSHYSEYYRVKSVALDRDVLSVLAAPWATGLERSLHWIAGWRPTTVFHLVYSESSILFESHIADILRGLRTGDLGDLSPAQFRRVSDLQCTTVREENAITEEYSEWQDSSSELLNPNADLEQKIGRLVEVVRKADDLRLRTIQNVVEFLTPQQAVEFLIAAGELQLGVRGWGLNHDRRREDE